MSHIISYPSSAWLEFKETRVCPCGPAITHPETMPFVWCVIDVLFQNEARISHFTLDLFYFKINTRCVLKNFEIYFRPATTNQIWLHFRLQTSEIQWNAPIDMLQTVAALSWWWWWWNLLGELTSLLPQWILEKNSAHPPFVKNYILIAISIAFQSFVSPVSLLKPFLIKTCLTLGHELYSVW